MPRVKWQKEFRRIAQFLEVDPEIVLRIVVELPEMRAALERLAIQPPQNFEGVGGNDVITGNGNTRIGCRLVWSKQIQAKVVCSSPTPPSRILPPQPGTPWIGHTGVCLPLQSCRAYA